MFIYISLLSIFFVYAMIDLVNIYIPTKAKNSQLTFLLIVLFFFTAFTKGIGFDVDAYSDYDIISNVTTTEPFFEWLYFILKSPQEVRLVTSLICVVLFGILIKRTSPLYFISLYMLLTSFVLMYMMGVLRQAIAIAIILSSWRLCMNKKILFIINVAIASLFHNSAIVAILYVFLPKNRLYSKKGLLIISVFSLVLFFVFINLMGYLAGGMIDVSGKLNHYNTSDLDTKPSIPLFLYRLFIVYLLYACGIGKDNSLLANAFILSLFMSLALSASSTIGGRLVVYFSITDILVVPMLLNNCPRLLRFPIGLLILLINGYLYFSFLNGFKDEYIPYYNWLF